MGLINYVFSARRVTRKTLQRPHSQSRENQGNWPIRYDPLQ